MLYRGDRSIERYYRLRFVPILTVNGEFALAAAGAAGYKLQLSDGVNVHTGYGLFVIVHLAQTQYRVHREEHPEHHVLRIDGNSNVIVEDLMHRIGRLHFKGQAWAMSSFPCLRRQEFEPELVGKMSERADYARTQRNHS